MAKRRKKSHRTTHRRRRMSGVGSGVGHELQELIGLVAGNIAATIVQRQATTINPKIVSILEMGGGYMLKKHAHTPLMTGFAYGLMSAGAIGLTHEVGLIHGVEDFVNGLGDGGYIESEHMHGLGNESYSVGGSVGGLGNEEHVGAMDFVNEM